MTSHRTALILIAAAHTFAQPSFFYPTTIPLGASITSIVGADFNGDGRGDFAVTFGVSGIAIFLSNANGGFTRKDLTPPAGAYPNPQLLAAADVNGDHVPDLVGFDFVFIGNGDGTFQPGIVFQGKGSTVLAVADFNQDGLADLLVLNPPGAGAPSFAVQFGHGDGTFSDPGPVAYLPGSGYQSTQNLTIGDLNGDGLPDVIWSNDDGFAAPDVWLGSGDGSFQYKAPASFNFSIPGGFQFLLTGDVNGDGKTDVIEQAGTITVFLGDGAGGLTIGPIYPPPPTFTNTGPLALADFERDGKVDLASYFYVLPGVGDGTFLPPVSFGQQAAAGSRSDVPLLVAEDVNGDGKPDLVGVGPTPDSITILINSTGTPVASAPAYLAPSGAPDLAPGALATLYGTGLSTTTMSGLDTVLGNVSLEIFDQAGNTLQPLLLYASPTQINFQMPETAAQGYAIINVLGNGLPKGANSVAIQPFSAGFFTTNGLGTGAPIASAVSVAPGGAQTQIPVNPLTVPADGQVYLSLYGTGFRHAATAVCDLGQTRSNPTQVTATYVGPEGAASLIDQINIPIPASTPKGNLDITCIFASVPFDGENISNTVTITVQ